MLGGKAAWPNGVTLATVDAHRRLAGQRDAPKNSALVAEVRD
jgi:hypothetical protein